MFVHFSLDESTLRRVTDRLYFGDLSAGHRGIPGAATVHACKDPCHKQAVGYEKSLDPTHPNYLSCERDSHLYLNMVDPPVPLFKHETFKIFFEFVDRHIASKPIVIHCNQGLSRAPSLALLYMAKRLDLVPNSDYASARCAFERQFPYSPGRGIETFLSAEWSSLGA